MRNGIQKKATKWKWKKRGNLKLEAFEVCVYAVSIIQN